MSNIISWWTVDNGVNEIVVNDSLRHTLKKTKKIQRRTRALNVELKKYASLKCYGEYVTIKTEILRNISDNEDTDDEPLARSAIALDSSYIDNVTVQCNRRNEKNVVSEYEYEEEAEEQRSKDYEWLQKKTHPTITCTEIVKSKYTIIRDKKDKSVDKRSNLSVCPLNEHSLQNKETIELDTLSAEARHVVRPNHINLLFDNGGSDTSQDTDDELLDTTDNLQTGQKRLSKELPSRQIISKPLDSDKWCSSKNNSCKKSKFYQSQDTNHSSCVSSPLQISDGNSVFDYTRKNSFDIRNEKSVKKSIKCQIAEQEFHDSSNKITIGRDEAKSVANTVTNGVPSEAESLRYVLRNLCSTGNKNSPEQLWTDEIEYSTLKTSIPTIQYPMEVFSRPMELEEFVHRQRLIATRELSTININDIKSSGEQDGNKEIWLMEIPRSIATDGHLLGKKIVLKRKKMKIGDASYKIIGRHSKSVSCILSGGKGTAHFKTVNLRPVGSIVVRQESYVTDDTSSASSLTLLCQSSAVRRRNATSEGLVPFPNNLKTRNPLVASNALNQRLKMDLTTSNED